MTSGIPGSTWKPHSLTTDRLRTWRRAATEGARREDIAASCGMTVPALDRMVQRARKAGHPDAVRHARAVAPGAGTWQLTGRKARTGGTT